MNPDIGHEEAPGRGKRSLDQMQGGQSDDGVPQASQPVNQDSLDSLEIHRYEELFRWMPVQLQFEGAVATSG
jgi:hypothetical protein